MEKIINLRLKKGDNGGILYVTKKVDETTYDCLAVAIVNQECYNKLKEIQGDYSKVCLKEDKPLKGIRDYLSRL